MYCFKANFIWRKISNTSANIYHKSQSDRLLTQDVVIGLIVSGNRPSLKINKKLMLTNSKSTDILDQLRNNYVRVFSMLHQQ
jgi:hypothetical protein